MKFFVPLLVLAACVFSACSTPSNRRDFYRPKEGDGPWTRSLEDGSYRERQLVDSKPGSSRQKAAAPVTPEPAAAKPPEMPQ